jgi:hypothetical protein
MHSRHRARIITFSKWFVFNTHTGTNPRPTHSLLATCRRANFRLLKRLKAWLIVIIDNISHAPLHLYGMRGVSARAVKTCTFSLDFVIIAT